jgi:cytochrome c553
MRTVFLAALLSMACAGTPVTARDDGSPLGADAESARAILRGHCGTCHRGDLPDNKPAAVKIFDLQRADWYATMSDAQLKKAPGRLSASEKEQKLFQAFIDAELARRAATASK